MSKEKIEKNNKFKYIVVVIILILAIIGVVVYINVLKPYQIAKNEYEKIAQTINENNVELDKMVEELQNLVNSEEKPLDETLLEKANEVIKNAQQAKNVLDKMPSNTQEIITKTEEMKKYDDYSAIKEELKETKEQLESSIKSRNQFINPSEEFLISRLSVIEEVYDIEAVTEEHDPNGHLHKNGGYTAAIYFKNKNVNLSKIFHSANESSIDIGTSGGGCIEVYSTEEDAQKRATYLSAFDGGILDNGTHTVVGTVVIRVSAELTATQQKMLEQNIIDSIAVLD